MKKMASRRARCGGMVPALPSFSLTVFTVVCCLASPVDGQDVSTTLDNLSPSFSPSQRPSSSLLFTTTSVEVLSPNSDMASTMSSPADAVSSTPLSVSSTPLSDSLSTTDTPTSATTDLLSSTDASSSHRTSQSSSSVVSSGMEHLSVSLSASLQSDHTTDSSMDSSMKLSSVSLTSGSLSDDFSSLVSDRSSMSSSGDILSTSPSTSVQTADVLQSLSSQDFVSGFSGNSIEPSMTSDLDSTMFVSDSSGLLVSTHSLPESASPSQSTLVESSMTFSESLVTKSSSSLEQSDVSSSGLETSQSLSDVTSVRSDFMSTNELSSLVDVSKSVSSLTSSAIDEFSPTSVTGLLSSSSTELDSTSTPSEQTTIQMTTSVFQTMSSPTSSPLETSTSDLGIGSSTIFSMLSPTPAATPTLDTSSLDVLAQSSFTQATVSEMSSTMMQEFSSVMTGVTTATAGDMHGSSSVGGESVSLSSVPAQSQSPVMSDLSSDSTFLSYTTTASVSVSFSSLISETLSSAFVTTSLALSDSEIIKSTVSSEMPFSMTVSQESPRSSVELISSSGYIQSSGTEVITSEIFSESPVSLASYSSTLPTSQSVTSSSMVTGTFFSSQQSTESVSATVSEDRLQTSSSQSMSMSSSDFISSESFPVSPQTASFFSSDLESSPSVPASVIVSMESPGTAHLKTTELLGETITQTVMSSRFESEQSHSPLLSSVTSSSLESAQLFFSSSSTVASSPAVWSSTDSIAFSSEGLLTTPSMTFSPLISSEVLSSYGSIPSGHTASDSSLSAQGTNVLSTEAFPSSTLSFKTVETSMSFSYTETVSGTLLSSFHSVNTQSLETGISGSSLDSSTMITLPDSSQFISETVPGSIEFSSPIVSSSLDTQGIVSSFAISSESTTVSYLSESASFTPELSSMEFSSTVESVIMTLESTMTQTDLSGVFSSQGSGSFSFSTLVAASSTGVIAPVTSVAQSLSHSEFDRSVLSSIVYSNPTPSMISTESLLTVSGSGLFTSDYKTESSGLSDSDLTVSFNTPTTAVPSESLLSTDTSFMSVYPSSSEIVSSFSIGMSTFSSAVSDSFISETVSGSIEFSSPIVSSSLDTQGIVSSFAISSESTRVSYLSESASFTPELSSMEFSSTVESVIMTLESTMTQTDLSGVFSSQGSGSFSFSTLVAASSTGVIAPVTSVAQSLSHSEFDRSVLSSIVYSNPTPSMISTESLLTVSGSGLFTSDYKTESSGLSDSGLTVSFNTPTTAVPSESLLSTDTSFISVYPSSSEIVSSFSIGMPTFSSAVSDSLLTNASISMSNVMPSSHSTIASGFISMDSLYLTPSDFTVFHTESGHTMITSSMQISGIESSSSMLFSSLLSSAVPPISPSSMYFNQSEETTVTVTVPSQSVTSVFSSPFATTVLTSVPTLLPSSEMLFSSDYVFSSVNQTGMFSSEGPSTASVPNGTFISSSDVHSSSTFISMHSSEMFPSNFPPFSTTIQTDLSLSVESFSGVTTLMSASFPSSFSVTAVQSTSLAQSSSLANTSSLSISAVTPSFSESIGGSSALTDLLATSSFSSIGTFTPSVSLPQSSFVLSIGLTATESSLLLPSETMGVSLATDLVTSSSEIKAPFSSAMLSSTETPFLSSVETYSTSYIPVPSFSTSFFSTESFPSSTGAVESAISSSISASGQPMPSSQSDVSMTVPSPSFVSTQSGIPESSSSVLPLESVSSAGFSTLSMSAPGSTTDFGPALSSSEIMTFSFSSPLATEMLSSSRELTTQMPLSDTSLFLSSLEESISPTVSTVVSVPVSTAILLTSTEIPTTMVESSMQTPATSDLQSSLFSEISMVTFTTIGTSSEVVVTSVSQSLYSSPSSELFSMSEVSEPSGVIASLTTTAVIPTSSVAGTSVEMSSLTIVTVGTSTVLETSIETSSLVTTSMPASSQTFSSEMPSSLVGSMSDIPSSILPSSEMSSILIVSSSQTEATSEILLLTSSEIMSSQSASSALSVTTSIVVLPSSSLEVVSSIVSSSSVDVSSEFLPLSSSLETMSSLEASSALGVSSSTVLPLSSSSLEVSSTETSTSVVMSSSMVETSSTIIPTPSFSSDIASSSLSPLPTTPSTTESNTTELTSTQPTTNTTTSSVPESLLVVTVILLRSTDNIQSQAFISAMEQGLARAFSLAFQRQREGASGSSRRKRSTSWLGAFLPSWAGGGVPRRKRAAVVNDVEIQMRDVRTQTANPSNAELTYTVKEKGQPVTAQQASQALNGLQDQELALELNRIVVTKARPAGETGASTGEDDKKLWIIGAVLGPVVFLVLVWLVVCLLVRYRANHSDKLQIETADQPHLLTAKHGNHSREGEVAEDPEYAQATLTQTNGLVKSSPHKARYDISTDPDTTATSTGREDSSSVVPKRGRRLPKKNEDGLVLLRASLTTAESTEGDQSSERLGERSTPLKKKAGKKSSFKETAEEMEMSPLDPSFYNAATLQSSRQLYAQQTFEEEDEEFLDSMEEERRKNKHRQRMKKKQGVSAAAPAPNVDTMQAAYERAQQEIDKVLGPRQGPSSNGVPGAATADGNKHRSKRRSKRGQANDSYRDDENPPAPAMAPSESLEEMKSRVHALLDDAFSLLSNSHTSMGSAVSERSRSFKRNKVAPASPNKPGTSGEVVNESNPPVAKSPPPGSMPAVEEVQDDSLAPKPGEKLHTPVLVDRTYNDYDPDGLITWSPYRASDETARIVLPDAQVPSAKAPAQEKLHTTVFMETATGNGPHYPHSTHPTHQVIRTRQPPAPTPPKTETPHSSSRQDRGAADKGSSPFGTTAISDMSYTPYPGLEAYENMLAETATTTAHFTSTTPSATEESGDHTLNGDVHKPEPDPPAHKPPTRDVGTRDERDFIASSIGTGTSAKELVDSIRQELQSLSDKVPPEEVSKARPDKVTKNEAATSKHQGVVNGSAKPLKKPRKSSYLDST